MGAPAKILVVDDEPNMLGYLRTVLEVDSHNVETASSGFEALQRIEVDPTPDLVLLDLLMPELDGLETLERLRQVRPGLKVIMLSCVSEPAKIVQAMRLGARNYLTKPFQKAALDAALAPLLNSKESSTALPGASAAGEIIEDLGDDLFFIGVTPAMRTIYTQVRAIAKVDVPVLLTGESGTGKEVMARLIHKLSNRSHRTFLKVNCAALPGELLESELFGYERGAFTGAHRPKPGKFEQCHKGTILLDEIAEMPTHLQAKLLHVLQDQQFSRLGGRAVVKVDVRILAATNVDIQQALATKKLREDLYYRLDSIRLVLPPLRERREAIPVLLRHTMALFAARYARDPLPITPTLLATCQSYDWPGNLRELENFVKRYLILGDEGSALNELAAKQTQIALPARPDPMPAVLRSGGLKSLVRNLKDEAEMNAISRTLTDTNWNRREASRRLNISYKALLYKIRQYGIQHSS